MKKTFASIWFLTFTLILITTNLLAGELDRLAGTWTNQSAVIPRLEIQIVNGVAVLQAWEKNGSDLRYLGRVPMEPFSRVSREGAVSVTAVFGSNGNETHLLLEAWNDQIQAKVVAISHEANNRKMEQFRYSYSRDDKARANHSSARNTTGTGMASGIISGIAFGPAKSTASLVRVSLYGPDNQSRYYGTENFNRNRRYTFENLPDGVYWMKVETGGDSGILVAPLMKKVIIQNGSAFEQNVEMR